ncbi:hypothetical protein BST95_15860 [Halioglobus japonicus]|uniref:DUF748 domain-containing protein n=1 Tax=Halioglobus japonicus TaxID=930805 RepID=A0AAP8SPF3_9GAMM|nr:DUF748 domain-containing protein [Halioglobus japonicus]AQA19491.1 hypothetical protein BST95_15860 [Halioglobus japonicus]PLW87449.1 DUF748 domain-containing protein [Halioglobus japonicus]GHD08408.1 ATPase [Halioglobus japonicus]
MVRKAARVLISIYIAWIALSVFVVLPALNIVPAWYLKEHYDRDFSTDITLFNPFNISLEMHNATLLQPDGSDFAALDQATVNLSLATLASEGIVFDRIAIEGLEITLRQDSPGEFNFSDLLATEETSDTADSDLLGVTISELIFTAKRITLIDNAREEPFSTHYDGLDIAVKDLSTIAEDGKPYQINVTAEAGGSLRWEGNVSVPLAQSEGWLAINDLSLAAAWRFARPWLNFDLMDGRLSMEGNYQLSWRDDVAFEIAEGQAQLHSLALVPRDTAALADTSINLNQLDIGDVSVDSGTSAVTIGSISGQGLQVQGWSEGAQVSLADMFITSFPEVEASESAAADEANPWQVTLVQAALADSGIQWRSEYTDPPQMTIAPITASTGNIRWPFAGSSPASLALKVNGIASMQVQADLELASGGANIRYELAALPLTWFNPNLPAALKATITDGQLGVNGSVELEEFAPVRLNLDSQIEQFSGKIANEEEAITRWDSVRLKQLAVDLPKRQASLQQLFIHKYEGRVHIAEDGSINASKIWQEEVGEQAEEIAEELELDKPWDFSVPEILISGSAIDFKDESLPISFRTVIGQVDGQILNISSAPGAAADIDISGSVDGYAPVKLAGNAEPLTSPPNLDLLLTFDGVDLVMMTPYSGTYAGYAIERGLLNLKLQYKLVDGRIEGDNQVLVDQLKLGEKVDSDKAVDLPLELALALLTDINGVIDLQVPVEGDIDDPSFALGGVIANAFLNLITKAVTAPFTLLASLVGSEEDLQRLGYGAGSSELNQAGQVKLDQLAEALRQRPGLTLVVSGAIDPTADAERLQHQILVQELVSEGFDVQAIDRRDPAVVKAVKARYVATYGEPPEDMSLTDQYRQVLKSIPLPADALRNLAIARAAATKDYLVNQQGLPADRAVVEVTQNLGEETAYSGVLMDLAN